ncbi:MAG: aldehyde dehydrogenase family protein, partial [Thiohalocapsa sp.]
VCVSVQRVYADQAIAEPLARRLAEVGASMRVGSPLDAQTEVGPLIRPSEVARVHEWVTEAVDAGARCLTGGQPLSDTCYPPTVLVDPPARVRVSREEVFGPVVCVYPYRDAESAIQRANGLRSAFQAAVFSRDIDFALGAASKLAASAVMINDHTAFRVDWMPFAGLKESGLGVGGIPYSFRDMRVEKLIVMHSPHL